MHEVTENPANERHRQIVDEFRWEVQRTANLFEVLLNDDRIRYLVTVIDAGREYPFLEQWFGSEKAARDFIKNKLMKKGG